MASLCSADKINGIKSKVILQLHMEGFTVHFSKIENYITHYGCSATHFLEEFYLLGYNIIM
jgi:hypothetical protein